MNITAITKGRFDPSATITVSKLNRGVKVRPYLEYLSGVSRLCPTTFQTVKYSARIKNVPFNDIVCKENTCTASVEVIQKFEGIRPNGQIYCDITTKLFEIKIRIFNNTYETKITNIDVKTTEPCGEKL